MSEDSDDLGSLAGLIKTLEQLAQDHTAHASHLRKQLRKVAQNLRLRQTALQQPSPKPVSPSRRNYDAWLTDLLSMVETAQPREVLLHFFVKRFSEIWGLDPNDQTQDEGDDFSVNNHSKHLGSRPCLLAFEETSRRGEAPSYLPLLHAGVNAAHWQKLTAALATTQEPMLHEVLVARQALPLTYLGALPDESYDGLFDGLVKGGRSRHVWLQAMPLGNVGETSAIFILYPSLGDTFAPHYPVSTIHDWQMLRFLAIAYRILGHQIRNLAAFVEKSRRELIHMLGPGLMHHEIGFVAVTITNISAHLEAALKKIDDEYDLPALTDQLARSRNLAELGQRLQHTTHAFNRLDRRGQTETGSLADVVDECRLLLAYRLDAAKIGLIIDANIANDGDIHTDLTLLTHALLNLCNNAINANGEDPERRADEIRHLNILLAPANLPERTGLIVCNDGPRVLSKDADHIFNQGYTTRAEGHGQGLFLVRLVAQYLGGEARLLADEELPVGYNCGFLLTLARQHDVRKEIGHEYR